LLSAGCRSAAGKRATASLRARTRRGDRAQHRHAGLKWLLGWPSAVLEFFFSFSFKIPKIYINF
jgi:hypothetical protein